MLTPVELGLLIQSTIYFTVVSEADDFAWTCNTEKFFSDACLDITFDYNINMTNQAWMVCGQGSISDFVAEFNTGDCGTVRANADLTEIASTDVCDPACYYGHTYDAINDIYKYYCICSTDSTAPVDTFTLDSNSTNECTKQFNATIIALFILLLVWLLRVFLEGTWNYRRFFYSVQRLATKNNALSESDLSGTWETLNSPWRAPYKIPFGIFDILTALGLCAIMFVLGINPYSFCEAGKLYACVALAALSVVNVITLIPFVIVLKCIQCRVGSRAELEMNEAHAEPAQ